MARLYGVGDSRQSHIMQPKSTRTSAPHSVSIRSEKAIHLWTMDQAQFLCEDKTFIDEVQQSRLLQDADRKTTGATLLIELQALSIPKLCDALNQISSKARDDWTNEKILQE